MFEAETIMTRDVVYVYPHTPIYEAMNVLVENRISGLPVVDKENNLVGIISEKDMLSILIDRDISEKQTVADYMTKDVIAFGPKDSAVAICDFLIQNPVRRVPIVDNGKLVGIVARRNIIELILRLRAKGK